MSTEIVSKPDMDNGYEEEDDDDKPLVFRRKTVLATNSNQLKSNHERSKEVPSTKVSPMRSPVISPNGATYSNRTSTMKSSMPSCSSKASPAESPVQSNIPSSVKDKGQSHKDQSECKREREDYEDERPLSCILSEKSSRPNKGSTAFRLVSKPDMDNGYEEEDDDDDKPLVFRRKTVLATNSNQLKSNPERSKEVPSTKVSPMRSPVISPNGATSSNRTSTMKSSMPSCSSKASPAKSPVQRNIPSCVKDKGQSHKDQSECKREREDYEDERPLSSILSEKSSRPNKGSTAFRLVSSLQPEKKNSSDRPLDRANRTIKDVSDDEFLVSSLQPEKRNSSDRPLDRANRTIKDELDDEFLVSSPQPEKKNSSDRPLDRANRTTKDESDDETLILSMVRKKKIGSGTSGCKNVSIDEKNPLAKKLHQNGSTLKNEEPNCKVLGKRPMEKSSADQSSSKKFKVSASPTSLKMKQDSARTDKGRVLVSPKQLLDDDDDDVPISKRQKLDSSNSKVSSAKPKGVKLNSTSSAVKFKAVKLNSTSSAAKPKVKSVVSPRSGKVTKNSKKLTKDSKYSTSSKSSPSSGDGQKKWTTLVHNGVIFPPSYKPHGIKILYKGKPVDLTTEQEEVATMFAVMRETDYYNKSQFRENFWNDWRQLLGKNHVIKNLDDCDFAPIYNWHLEEKEKKKQMSTEEKKALKEEKLKQEEKYMWAIVDGVKEKVGNFRVEPPGLFRGRGEHPKMGKLKRRIRPCEITINIGKGAPIPECPIPGERWKDVKHDNTVTWLAFWVDPINQKEFKYVFLAASSALKGLSDKEKYEKARNLTDYIDNIRSTYTKNFTAKDVTSRQIAVATYLIDKLALRAGNEKDDDEADTVGCCTLKVGNVECIPPNKIKFDFLGKDSIQYVNTVEVEPLVYKAIGQFQAGKSKTDDLFDELDTSKLNAHLKELMPGLTAKVFRTYNASITLDAMLSQETKDGDVPLKLVVYQKANKEVAIICNHQRTVSKSHGAQIEKLTARIEELKEGLKELKTNLDRAKKGKPPLASSDGKKIRSLDPNAWEKKITQQNLKIQKIERDMHTKEDLKTVALGTSKINYLDPRITVAWCKRHEVPIEKIFTKTLLEKFAWAMDVEPSFRFPRGEV